MSGIDATSTSSRAFDAVENQQRQVTLRRALANAPWRRQDLGASTSKPPRALSQEPVDSFRSGSEDSASEQEEEPQSNSKVACAPPPGIFKQSDVSEKASKIAPPPGVFIQSRAALPCLLGKSFSRQTTKQHVNQEHRRGETKATLEPPPGLFVGALDDFKGSTASSTTVLDQEKPCDVIKLPPDFRAPPGLEHMVDLRCYKVLNTATPYKVSRATSEDNLSTVVGSSIRSSSAGDLEDISSDDEPAPNKRTEPNTVAESFRSAELDLDDRVYAGLASNIVAPVGFALQMPIIPFVPVAAVHMAWQQWYGRGAISGKYKLKQAKV